MIFCTHRELFKLRPAWRDPIAPECPGKLIVADDQADIWEARCDVCYLEIGIPPRQQKAWLGRQGVVS